MNTLYMMVGLSGSGKSTWIKENINTAFIYSTDKYIEDKATSLGSSYSDIFKDTYKEAEEYMNGQLEKSIYMYRDVVWDQTNLTVKSRASKLSKFPQDYKKICVLFDNFDVDFLYDRMVEKRPEKIIPYHVLVNMAKSFQMPTLEEGFDEIIKV